MESDKTLDAITEMVKEKEREFPPEYSHYIHISKVDSDDIWCILVDSFIDEEAVLFLGICCNSSN